jgi:hypothetical protein
MEEDLAWKEALKYHSEGKNFEWFLQDLLSIRSPKTLVSVVGRLIMFLQDMGYHTSQVFEGMASYARHESRYHGDNRQTWEAVAALLEAAAKEAETPGRELP